MKVKPPEPIVICELERKTTSGRSAGRITTAYHGLYRDKDSVWCLATKTNDNPWVGVKWANLPILFHMLIHGRNTSKCLNGESIEIISWDDTVKQKDLYDAIRKSHPELPSKYPIGMGAAELGAFVEKHLSGEVVRVLDSIKSTK